MTTEDEILKEHPLMTVLLHRAWGPATFLALVIGIATLWTLPARMTANERLDSVQDGKIDTITQ